MTRKPSWEHCDILWWSTCPKCALHKLLYCGCFFPRWVLSAESGNGKMLWFVTYLPRVIWRLKNIYDVIKNYFENGNFFPWFLDNLALLSGLCTIRACSGCTKWLTRAPQPLRDKMSMGKIFFFAFRSFRCLSYIFECMTWLWSSHSVLVATFVLPGSRCWGTPLWLELVMWASQASCTGCLAAVGLFLQTVAPNNVVSEKGKKHEFVTLLDLSVCCQRPFAFNVPD